MSETTLVADATPDVPALTNVPAEAPTPAAAPPEGAVQATPEATQEGDGNDKPEKPRQRWHERIGELYGQKKAVERERDSLAAELQRLRQPTVSREQFDQMPFDDQQRSIVRDAVREERALEVEQAAIARHNEAEALVARVYNDRIAQAAERIPDLIEKLNDETLPITDFSARIIAESEKGPQMAYWLASNREEAKRISRLGQIQQAKELGRLEERINASPAARKISKAPAPVPTVGSGSGSGPKSPASMSAEDMGGFLREKGLIR